MGTPGPRSTCSRSTKICPRPATTSSRQQRPHAYTSIRSSQILTPAHFHKHKYVYLHRDGDDPTLQKYCQMLNNVIFLCVPSLFPVSSASVPLPPYFLNSIRCSTKLT